MKPSRTNKPAHDGSVAVRTRSSTHAHNNTDPSTTIPTAPYPPTTSKRLGESWTSSSKHISSTTPSSTELITHSSARKPATKTAPHKKSSRHKNSFQVLLSHDNDDDDDDEDNLAGQNHNMIDNGPAAVTPSNTQDKPTPASPSKSPRRKKNRKSSSMNDALDKAAAEDPFITDPLPLTDNDKLAILDAKQARTQEKSTRREQKLAKREARKAKKAQDRKLATHHDEISASTPTKTNTHSSKPPGQNNTENTNSTASHGSKEQIVGEKSDHNKNDDNKESNNKTDFSDSDDDDEQKSEHDGDTFDLDEGWNNDPPLPEEIQQEIKNMHNHDSEAENSEAGNSETEELIMNEALVFKRVHTRWLLRFKNVPKGINATKLTKYQTLGAWIGLCIDFIHENSYCRISFTTPTGSIDADQVAYQQQFAKLSDDELHALFDLPSRLDDTQTAVTVDIMVDCMGRDHDNVFIDAERAIKTTHKAELTTISITDPGNLTPWERSMQEKKAKDLRYEQMCGAPPNRLTLCRYSLKIDCAHLKTKIKRVKKGQTTEDALDLYFQGAIGTAFDVLNDKINGSLIFCRWKQQHKNALPITTDKHSFQTQFRKMSYVDFVRRFNRFRPKELDKFLWLDILVGHNETNEDFNQIASFALDDWHLSLFPKALQDAEESVQLGWILWTSNQLDTAFMQEHLATQMKMDVEVSLKRVRDGTKYSSDKRIEDTKKAWHISVSRENAARGLDIAKRICSRRNHSRPLYGTQRLVPLYGTASTDKEEQFITKAQSRQFAFMSKATTITCSSIANLDASFFGKDGKKVSLRQIIGNIKRKDKPHVNLFMDIGYAARTEKTAVIFLCAPLVQSQAQLTSNTLIPYCRQFYGDGCLACFHASSVADMHDVTWDVEKHQAISPHDHIWDEADKLDADAGFDLEEIPDEEIQRDLVDNADMVTAKDAATSRMMTGNEDMDTLGSFGKVNDGTKGNETASLNTCATTETSINKIAILEQQIKSLMGDNSVSDQSLSKKDRIKLITNAVDSHKKKKAASTRDIASNSEAATAVNADILSVSSASDDSSSSGSSSSSSSSDSSSSAASDTNDQDDEDNDTIGKAAFGSGQQDSSTESAKT
jgi:hypothetical protein